MYPKRVFKSRIASQQIIKVVLPFYSNENNIQYKQTKHQPRNQIPYDVGFVQVTTAFLSMKVTNIHGVIQSPRKSNGKRINIASYNNYIIFLTGKVICLA